MVPYKVFSVIMTFQNEDRISEVKMGEGGLVRGLETCLDTVVFALNTPHPSAKYILANVRIHENFKSSIFNSSFYPYKVNFPFISHH